MDKLRVFEIAIDDIAIDPGAASGLLNATLKRGGRPMTVAGMCSDDSLLYLSLCPAAAGSPTPVYRFAELSGYGRDAIASAITARFYAGFTTVGSFATADSIWALFRRDGDGEGR